MGQRPQAGIITRARVSARAEVGRVLRLLREADDRKYTECGDLTDQPYGNAEDPFAACRALTEAARARDELRRAGPDHGKVTVSAGGSDCGEVTVSAGGADCGEVAVSVGGSDGGEVTVSAGGSDDGKVTRSLMGSDDRIVTSELHADAGMSTVEYAVGTVVAAAFAAVLYRIVTGDSIVSGLTNLVESALNTTF